MYRDSDMGAIELGAWRDQKEFSKRRFVAEEFDGIQPSMVALHWYHAQAPLENADAVILLKILRRSFMCLIP